ncbi:MAG: phosphatidate cytidylyltransferase [Burkholderiaceae bacterium]
MLRQRIITALVLLAVLMLALTLGRPFGFPIFALVMVGFVTGEWLQLLSLSKQTSIVVSGVMMFAMWMIDTTSAAHGVALVLWAAATLVWLALAVSLFVSGRFPPSDRWRMAYACLALLLPAACWFALVEAYRQGLVFLVSILAIVWAADIAAYFAGKAFGKRKLAPSISPGKTWAGAIGGAVATVLLAFVAMLTPVLSDSFFAVLAVRWRTGWPIVAVLAVTLLLVILSVVGDLFESQLKRQRGVKDSGRMLPGHGGVFDRVDALLPIVPVAMLLGMAA